VSLRTLLGVGRMTAGRSKAGEHSQEVEFSQLFDRHAQAVYAFCACRVADLALAEDLMSMTFLEAWRHRARMPSEQDGSRLPWLLGVANNVVRNARRGQRRYRAALERLPSPPSAPPAEDQAVARAETEAKLRDALDAISALSEQEQEVVMVVLWSGLSYGEAATALEIPVGTVRSRLSRARAKLQIALGDETYLAVKESI
jgi:RNA polymerase sigma factor (sigma-70 family)